MINYYMGLENCSKNFSYSRIITKAIFNNTPHIIDFHP